jgi:N12 class adenine-specific DNA methylase
MELVKYIQANWVDIANIIAYVIAGASVVVKLTPSKIDDGVMDKIVAFVGKYIALNK